jgi:large subunit ribosomal protein L1
MAHGKKYRESEKKFDRETVYPLDAAVDLVKQLAYAKFDESVDIAIRLNKQKKEISVRDTLVLPHSFQKEKSILVFAKGDKAEEARKAGAQFVGAEDLIEKIKGGWLDFDVAVATPDMMKDVGKLGQILGRRGLMPNPKTRTVTFELTATIAELRKGRVEFRADKAGVIHLPVGKVSMGKEHILENIQAVLGEVEKKRPDDVKGEFIRSIAISSTMGPGVKVSSAN